MRPYNGLFTLTLFSTLALGGCGGSPGGAVADLGAVIDESKCARATLEPDLQIAPMQGPGVDANGKLAHGQYVLSSTYLKLTLDPGGQKLFQQLIGDIFAALKTQPGLVGYQVGTSVSCGSARTLAVWADQTSMFGFVTGQAHAAAVAKIGTISRGGSAVTHWNDDETGATLTKGASQVGAVTVVF